MATSPNYAWAEPDNSSLVKNGAADIRTLGDAIDTSVWNVGYGQAGKNKIINGDFTINQRGFTSTTTVSTYGFDRWRYGFSTGTITYSAQTFTTGSAPVTGYEAANFARIQTTGQSATNSYAYFDQSVEDVRTFANQTTTVSFWAKAASGTPKVAVEFQQNFGQGGSPSAAVVTYAGQVTLSTSWARYSVTALVPSISGKTIGTTANTSSVALNLWVSGGSDFNARTGSIGIQTNTFDFWGVQWEYGSKATPFQTASGDSIQGELAMCQRYYYRNTSGAAYVNMGIGAATSTTASTMDMQFPVTMRIAPTSIDFSTLRLQDFAAGYAVTTLTIGTNGTGFQMGEMTANVASGLTSGKVYWIGSNNSSTGYIAFSAEL